MHRRVINGGLVVICMRGRWLLPESEAGSEWKRFLEQV